MTINLILKDGQYYLQYNGFTFPINRVEGQDNLAYINYAFSFYDQFVSSMEAASAKGGEIIKTTTI